MQLLYFLKKKYHPNFQDKQKAERINRPNIGLLSNFQDKITTFLFAFVLFYSANAVSVAAQCVIDRTQIQKTSLL